MAKAIGLGKYLFSQAPLTEGELFRALDMHTGEKYIVSGAIVHDGVTLIVSAAICEYANMAALHGVAVGGGPVTLELFGGGNARVADSCSLAW
jgi:hypothetical protein